MAYRSVDRIELRLFDGIVTKVASVPVADIAAVLARGVEWRTLQRRLLTTGVESAGSGYDGIAIYL